MTREWSAAKALAEFWPMPDEFGVAMCNWITFHTLVEEVSDHGYTVAFFEMDNYPRVLLETFIDDADGEHAAAARLVFEDVDETELLRQPLYDWMSGMPGW